MIDNKLSFEETNQIIDFAKQLREKMPTLTEEEVFAEIIKLIDEIYWKRFTESITRYEEE